MFVQEHFSRIKKVYGTHAVTTTSINRETPGESVSIQVFSGTVWVNTTEEAATNNNSVQLNAGMSLDVAVDDVISYVSDGSGAEVQVITWQM